MSREINVFDWVAFSMKTDDGRVREDTPNGSTAMIKIKTNRLYITLTHKDGLTHEDRFWEGELVMSSFGHGTVAYKYTDKHEYGKRDCVVGTYKENGKQYDYIFLTPVNDRIQKIVRKSDKEEKPEYNYGKEILIRERVSN